MRILVSGARGLIGAATADSLAAEGHEVVRLVRRTSTNSSAEIEWSPETGVARPGELEGIDAIVHLAGESIAGGRWTVARKNSIRDSRVIGTSKLVEAVLSLKRMPSVFLCASAIGYYGDCGEAVVDESSPAGRGFLAEVCQAWEGATAPLAAGGVRVVNLRFGVVLSARGGALQKMLVPFRLGLGGVVGSGRQYMSWVSLDDAAGAVTFGLSNDRVRGPVNVVAPRAVTNTEFTRALGRALKRPTVFPLPAFALRLALGEMADALLLGSTRVTPRRLLDLGYVFKHTEINETLQSLVTHG
ncbi:MAG: TIGR01777 family protein [Candidatus Hydrogenedentes bacterium]|nr:TIGR01777 family protein [Candidatus Hydrogenedentota bacterium]